MANAGRALKIVQLSATPVSSITDDPTGLWIGFPNQWTVVLQVIPTLNSGATSNFEYDATNIAVGNWISTSARGIAVKIIEIVSIADNSSVTLTVSDEDSYNVYNDETFSGTGIGPNGPGLLFPLDEISGLPVLGPVDAYYNDLNTQMDLFARFIQQGKLKGGSKTLDVPTDGTYSDGAITSWTPGVTLISDAFDGLNTLIKKTLPAQPTTLAAYNIKFTTQTPVVEGTLLANGLIPNFIPGTQFTYATPMIAVSNVSVVSTPILGVGLANSGSISMNLNTVQLGTRALDGLTDVGTYGNSTGAMTITSEYQYDTQGVWKAMDMVLAATAQDGVNEIDLIHTVTGTSAKQFVVENMLLDPIITNPQFSVVTQDLVYSSGVPHLTAGSTFSFGMTGANLAGRSFPAKGLMRFTTNPLIGEALVNPDTPGMPSIIAINNAPMTVSNQPMVLDGTNIAAKSDLQFIARNSFKQKPLSSGTSILYLEGTGQFLQETPSDSSQNLGLRRISLAADRPVVGSIDYDTAFDSGAAGSPGDLQLWESPIVAGSAVVDTTDYSTGYLPVGPDFSAKPSQQWISFKLQGITNRLTLQVIGKFSRLYVKLPGITNDMPNATNGWWDATKQADFAPTIWPGADSASDGCLLDNTNGVVSLTFGNTSSAFSTENLILLQFMLQTDDRIDFILASY